MIQRVLNSRMQLGIHSYLDSRFESVWSFIQIPLFLKTHWIWLENSNWPPWFDLQRRGFQLKFYYHYRINRIPFSGLWFPPFNSTQQIPIPSHPATWRRFVGQALILTLSPPSSTLHCTTLYVSNPFPTTTGQWVWWSVFFCLLSMSFGCSFHRILHHQWR